MGRSGFDVGAARQPPSGLAEQEGSRCPTNPGAELVAGPVRGWQHDRANASTRIQAAGLLCLIGPDAARTANREEISPAVHRRIRV